jgi:hypothetical protein
MPPRLTLTDQEFLDYSREHLLYELQMFRLVARALPTTPDNFERYALIESCAIHTRNLIDFFYNKSPMADDVIAADFFGNATTWKVTIPSSLDQARVRANKEVSHLTLQRKSGAHPDKAWPLDVYYKAVQAVAVTFVNSASPKKLHADVKNWVAGRVAVVSAGFSTNTTSGTI